MVLLDLSSFKCGHDAPTYGIVDRIVEQSALPHLALHDIDANKPGGSIKIRVKTYVHSLKLHEERLDDVAKKKLQLVHRLDLKRLELLNAKVAQLAARQQHDPALLAQIEALGDKVRAYVPPTAVPEEPKDKAGLIQLRRKQPTAESASV